MKILKFAPHLVPSILSGGKTTTWRLFDEKDLKVGDKLVFINKENGEKFAKAKIISISEKKLGELEGRDFEGHERYKDQKVMIENYRKYYGDKVTLDTKVKMVRFKLI